VGIKFNNVDPAIFNSASTRNNIVTAFAKAAKVDASKVEITSIINKDTNTKIYPVGRRLSTANVEVISRIIVADAAAASSLSTTISNTMQTIATDVVTDLKISESANFASVTATVTTVAVVNPPATSETTPALSVGAIIGIVIGVLAAFGIAGYIFHIRNKIDNDSDADASTTKNMYNNPMPKKTAKVQSSV